MAEKAQVAKDQLTEKVEDIKLSPEIQELIKMRSDLRKAEKYADADKIRDKLIKDYKIEVHDYSANEDTS